MLGTKPRIHFVGIGGIGMSGIAELLMKQGFIVSGSDMNQSEITKHLEDIGAAIFLGHAADFIKDADIVVKSSAVKDDNPEISAAIARKIPVIRRAEMLSEVMRMSYGIAVAGTHGKTTTTSMVGMILQAAGLSPTVIVGGKVKNFGSNNLLGSGKHIVVEADEFDRSFLTLTPVIASITNIEADHLDCYADLDAIKKAFVEFANKVPFFGCIIACLDDHGIQSIIPLLEKKLITYGMSRQADVRATDIELKDFKATYLVKYRENELGRIKLKVSGRHNVLNSLLAVAVGLELDIPFEKIAEGLSEFSGVFRRFEYKGKYLGTDIYDDYAHHPSEITATLKGIRENTDRRIITVFQPHLYSRTRDFSTEFGTSFFQSDVLIVTPIYPARELPIPGVTGKIIADAAVFSGHRNVLYVDNNDDIVNTIRNNIRPDDILVTMGAGNIYKYAETLLLTDK